MRRMAEGRAFVISSPSGGGKTTVVERLRRRLPSVVRSVSVTTRSPRPRERQGRDYRFVSVRQFQRMRRAGQLLEWASVHGASYGTLRRPVMQALTQGRDVLLSIDVQGARQVRRALGRRAVLIFLLPPSLETLRQRLLRRRTESRAALRQRLAAAKHEMACADWYDYAVTNDRLERAVREIEALVRDRPTQGGTSPHGPSRH